GSVKVVDYFRGKSTIGDALRATGEGLLTVLAKDDPTAAATKGIWKGPYVGAVTAFTDLHNTGEGLLGSIAPLAQCTALGCSESTYNRYVQQMNESSNELPKNVMELIAKGTTIAGLEGASGATEFASKSLGAILKLASLERSGEADAAESEALQIGSNN